MGKFLNRILGMEVQQQNALFQYFSDTLAAVILEAKKSGRYDMGILGKPDVTLHFCRTDTEAGLQQEAFLRVVTHRGFPL